MSFFELFPRDFAVTLLNDWIDSKSLCVMDSASTNCVFRSNLLDCMQSVSSDTGDFPDSVYSFRDKDDLNTAFLSWTANRGLFLRSVYLPASFPLALKLGRVQKLNVLYNPFDRFSFCSPSFLGILQKCNAANTIRHIKVKRCDVTKLIKHLPDVCARVTYLHVMDVDWYHQLEKDDNSTELALTRFANCAELSVFAMAGFQIAKYVNAALKCERIGRVEFMVNCCRLTLDLKNKVAQLGPSAYSDTAGEVLLTINTIKDLKLSKLVYSIRVANAADWTPSEKEESARMLAALRDLGWDTIHDTQVRSKTDGDEIVCDVETTLTKSVSDA